MTLSSDKTIKISGKHHAELAKLASWGETMDDIVGKLLESYKKIRGLHDKGRLEGGKLEGGKL